MIKKSKAINKHTYIGLIGMLILQSNQIPLIIQSYNGYRIDILNPIIVILGLSFYMYYAIFKSKDMLYICSNGIGIFFATTLLILNL